MDYLSFMVAEKRHLGNLDPVKLNPQGWEGVVEHGSSSSQPPLHNNKSSKEIAAIAASYNIFLRNNGMVAVALNSNKFSESGFNPGQ